MPQESFCQRLIDSMGYLIPDKNISCIEMSPAIGETAEIFTFAVYLGQCAAGHQFLTFLRSLPNDPETFISKYRTVSEKNITTFL